MLFTDMEENAIMEIFPQNYEYKIVSDISNSNMSTFKVELRVNIKTEEEVKIFLNELNESSGCTFNIQSGRPDKKPSKDTQDADRNYEVLESVP